MKRPIITIVCAAAVAVGALGCDTEDHSVKLTIDGKPQTVAGAVSCSSHSGGFAISAGMDPLNVFVRLIPWQKPLLVGSVSLGSFIGTPLFYHGKPDGSDVVEVGETYKIHGDAVLQKTPPTTETKPFELELTCP